MAIPTYEDFIGPLLKYLGEQGDVDEVLPDHQHLGIERLLDLFELCGFDHLVMAVPNEIEQLVYQASDQASHVDLHACELATPFVDRVRNVCLAWDNLLQKGVTVSPQTTRKNRPQAVKSLMSARSSAG